MYGVYNPQVSIDRINNQIAELEKMKASIPPIPQATNLTQNFQLAPSKDVIKYANSIDEVEKDIVIGDTPYFSKDMSVVWIKNIKGEIKSYELKEIVQKDEKDIMIDLLQAQINELKGMIDNEHNANDDPKSDETSTSKDDGAIGTTTKESKPTNVQRISRSKAK